MVAAINKMTMILVAALAVCALIQTVAANEAAPEMPVAIETRAGRSPSEPWPCTDIRIKPGQSHEEANKECYTCCTEHGGLAWFVNVLYIYQYCLCANFSQYGR